MSNINFSELYVKMKREKELIEEELCKVQKEYQEDHKTANKERREAKEEHKKEIIKIKEEHKKEIIKIYNIIQV
jgi:hypothetical protein